MRGWLPASIGAGLAMALFAGLFSLTTAADRIEHRYGLGLLFRVRGPVEPPAGAVVVALDRETMAWLRSAESEPTSEHARLLSCIPASARSELGRVRGPGSLPRAVHACLLDELRRIGFSAVVFDILFSVEGAEEDDALFAEALKEHGATAILVGFERSTVRDGPSELLVEREVQPLPLFRESAAAAGAFVVPRAGGPVYGYWRTVPGFESTPSLPEEALRLQGYPGAHDRPDLPLFRYLWLYGPPGSIPSISVREVLGGDVPEEIPVMAPRSVAFIGASDPSTADFPDSFPSFFRGVIDAGISGVELAATAFLNLRAGEILRGPAPAADAAFIAAFAFVLGFLARARSGLGMLAAPAAALAAFVVAAIAFSHFRLLLPVGTTAFVVAPLAFLLAVVIRYRFARALIMRLAPAPVARRMLTKATDHRDAPVAHEATVVFFDLIGSSAIGEKIPPVDFSQLLNAYFDTVTAAVEGHRGLVSGFAGDGVMAVFTGSSAGQNHAVRACRSVQAVVRGLAEINERNAKSDLPPLRMRVGLNTGNVAEGEIGARDRFNFSAVGDVVNLASRLEQLGKALFPGEADVILVGGATRRMADGGGLAFIDCGTQSIPGRERAEQVYRLSVD